MASWLESHPDSVYAMRMKVKNLITNKKWDEALELALRLQTLLPSDASNDGVYAMLATIHRAKEDVQQERLAWIQLANLSADCRQALLRLLEIDRQSEDFESMLVWCERLVQIDPLRLDVQSARAQAAFQRGNSFLAIRALQACLQLGPIDPAGVHYQMALAHESNHELDQAKRQVLLALEESPRYIEALKLLAKIRKQLESQAVQSTKEGVSP
jgi:tetratricopeptide (TPR) repeat protein